MVMMSQIYHNALIQDIKINIVFKYLKKFYKIFEKVVLYFIHIITDQIYQSY